MKNLATQIQLRLRLVFSLIFLLLILATYTDRYFVVKAQGNPNVYHTNFDNLSSGVIIAFPAPPGLDGWEYLNAGYGGFSAIQSNISVSGKALQQHIAANFPPGAQTIVKRPLGTDIYGIDISSAGKIILQTDFYAKTSNLNAINLYNAAIIIPGRGYIITKFDLVSGNGLVKGQDGVSVRLGAFDPSINAYFNIPLSVGQHLAWNTWHKITIVIDHRNNRYDSVIVDGIKQNLSSYLPPYGFDGVQWQRGQFMEHIEADLVPVSFGADVTDDDVYWDNLQLRVTK